MWTGRRGLTLTILLALFVAGFVWMGWIGAPAELLNPRLLVISRGKFHARAVGPGMWWASACMSWVTMAAAVTFILTGVAFGQEGPSTRPGRNYGGVAAAIGVTGMLLSLIGSMISSSGT